MDLGHLLPQPLLFNFRAHTNFDRSHSQQVVRGKCTIFFLYFISHVPSLKTRTYSSLPTFACGLTHTKYSWQSHQYSGYFGITLQLLVAGELPVSSTLLEFFTY